MSTESRFKRWRTDHDLTLTDIAGLTGLSQPYLSRVERGEAQMSPLTRVRVARQLGAKVSDLFEPVEGAAS